MPNIIFFTNIYTLHKIITETVTNVLE